MANPQAQRYAQQATYALQQGELAQALSFIEQAIGIEPASADAHVIRGVILAQLRRPDEASDAFNEAIRLAPNDPKGYYNLAVHYNGLGRTQEALDLARRALSLDPRHAASAALVHQLEAGPTFQTPSMSPPPETRTGFSGPEQPFGPMPGYPMPPMNRGIGFVRGLGKAWDAAGWMLSATGALIFAFNMNRGFQIGSGLKKSNMDISELMNELKKALDADSQYRTISYLGLGVALLTLIWLIVDLLDKRASGLWALPGTICCICGLQWLILPFYITMGRK